MTEQRTLQTNVGQGIEAENAGWSFGGEVADTFGDHVRREVVSFV